jgi:acyl carrier protein
MLERTRAIVADIFEVPLERVLPESSPDTIETWDSIHHLNLVLALEQEFGIEFSPEEIEQLLSVELIVALLAEKIPVVESV